MSAEAGVLAAIGKYLWLPFIALFGWLAKKYADTLENKLEKLSSDVVELEKQLSKNYYDKVEIREQIVEPLLKDMGETKSELKKLSETITSMSADLAIMKFKLLGEELEKKR